MGRKWRKMWRSEGKKKKKRRKRRKESEMVNTLDSE